MPTKHTSSSNGDIKLDKESLLKNIEKNLPENKDKQLIHATVLEIGERSVLLDANLKSDGVVSLNEFKDTPNLKVGDKAEVYIETQENQNGELVLSRKKARKLSSWKTIESAHLEEKTLIGKVISRVKGGLEVAINDTIAFLPGSQIDTNPVTDFDALLGQKIEVSVLSINPVKQNAVVSRRALLENEQRALVEKLEEGQVLEGTIKNITHFGVFVELAANITGLVYVKETSWDKKVTHPDQITDDEGNPLFVIGDPIKVVVKEIEEQEGSRIPRIALSTRALLPNPWDDLTENLDIGSVVTGTVTDIQERGICVKIENGVEGFVHISEMTRSNYPYLQKPSDIVEPGQEVKLQVLKLDREKQDLRLSMKELFEDLWQASDFLEKYGLDTRHKAIVCKFGETSLDGHLKIRGTHFEIEPGIEGFLDNEQISWVKKILRGNDYFQIGETHEIIVLGVNEEKKMLKLGMRELEDSPWDAFEETFTIGSEHEGIVKNKYKSGAIIELPYGLQEFVRNKELAKEDGSLPSEGETLKFRIVDFIKYEHKVLLSHVDTYKAPQAQKEEKEMIKKMASRPVTKTTLSDLASLNKLKEKLTEKEEKAKEEKMPKEGEKTPLKEEKKEVEKKEKAKKEEKKEVEGKKEEKAEKEDVEGEKETTKPEKETKTSQKEGEEVTGNDLQEGSEGKSSEGEKSKKE